MTYYRKRVAEIWSKDTCLWYPHSTERLFIFIFNLLFCSFKWLPIYFVCNFSLLLSMSFPFLLSSL